MGSTRCSIAPLAVTLIALVACAEGRVMPGPGRTFADAGGAPDAAYASAPDARVGTDAASVEPDAELASGPGSCGDGACDRATETCGSCAVDCGACPSRCGDGSCDPTETETSCSLDCVREPSCGDGACDASETCASCSRDCGACPARCGDATCDATESCSSCSRDCGTCGGGGSDRCSGYRTCGACVDDSGCGFCDGVCTLGAISGPLDGRSCGSWTWWSWAC